jgi:ATP-binding cassette, subfamily A (ABC1), member 3
MWTMMQQHKKDRIVILTTHYMDEADILGDRIGIMAQGKISSLGTSLFLKKKFGIGYNVTMIKKDSEDNTSIMPFFDKNLGPKIKKVGEIKTEFTVQIPDDYSDKFATFFEDLN